MSITAPSPTNRHEALRALLFAWVRWAGMVFAALLDGELDALFSPNAGVMMRFERWLKGYLLCRALPYLPRPPRGRDYRREPPPGFRRREARGSWLRKLTRNVLGPAHGLRARMRRFVRVLADPHRYVVRLIKRALRGFIGLRTVRAAPPPRRFTSGAPALTPCAADSS